MKLLVGMRQYEGVVPVGVRSGETTISRKLVETYVQALIVHFIGALRGSFERGAPRLAGLSGPAEAWAVVKPMLDTAIAEGYAHLETCPFDGEICPAWFLAAIESAVQTYLP